MSDLFGNHIVGFPTRRLNSIDHCFNVHVCISHFYDNKHLQIGRSLPQINQQLPKFAYSAPMHKNYYVWKRISSLFHISLEMSGHTICCMRTQIKDNFQPKRSERSQDSRNSCYRAVLCYAADVANRFIPIYKLP